MISVPLPGALALCLSMLFSLVLSAAPQPVHQVDDIIMLDQLVNLYEPVPFDHKSHADMADMWEGCTTCHHHQPAPGNGNGATTRPTVADRRDTVTVPACKSCHPVEAELGTIQLPSLKGAYHRQCLNCHREWTGANACGACHAPRGSGEAVKMPPSVDDITGRMHKPIPSPETINIVARYTPVAGPNVLFRHEAHIKQYGIRCSSCHRHDNCSNCHSESAAVKALPEKGSRLMRSGATWREAHEPCASCHASDDCTRCHYQPGQEAPPAFTHEMTGQMLDKNHSDLACRDCHAALKTKETPTCGDAGCHKQEIAFPTHRPGALIARDTPRVQPAQEVTGTPAPATRPVIIRVRRGGL